jgi:hypothetical protein
MHDWMKLLNRSVIPPEAAVLFAALHSDHLIDSMLSLNNQQWDRLLRFSDLAHLTLPLAQKKTIRVPDWVRSRLDKNLNDNRDRFRRVKGTYLEADESLREAGVEYVVIKGFSLSQDFVEAPWLRQQSDLDLYCGTAGIEPAKDALMAIGYRPDTMLDFRRADHSPTLFRLGQWRWGGNAFDPEMPLSIELHFSLWNEGVTLLHDNEIRRFFDRRERRTIEDMEVPVLQDIDILGHLSMHILRNLLVYDTVIHHVYELATFLNKKSNDGHLWSRWQAQHSETLRSKEVIAFELARQCFGCRMPDAAREVLGRLPNAQRAWLKHFGRMPMELPFRENKDSVWLHWSLLGQSGHRKTVIRRAFFPNRLPGRYLETTVLNERVDTKHQRKSTAKMLGYVCRRLASYSCLSLRTLYHGAIWRLRSSGIS